MTEALPQFSTTQWVLIIVGIVLVVAIVAGLLGRALIRRGLQEPFVVRFINRSTDRLVAAIKKPLTVAVLDEVADVLRTGNYTRNLAAALEENQSQLRAMIAEKIKNDPTAGRIGLLPFHDRIVDEVTETALRVFLEVLLDPRTDELVSDLLRDNIDQIRQAVRENQHEPVRRPSPLPR